MRRIHPALNQLIDAVFSQKVLPQLEARHCYGWFNLINFFRSLKARVNVYCQQQRRFARKAMVSQTPANRSNDNTFGGGAKLALVVTDLYSLPKTANLRNIWEPVLKLLIPLDVAHDSGMISPTVPI
jgi:hypothetical protein